MTRLLHHRVCPPLALGGSFRKFRAHLNSIRIQFAKFLLRGASPRLSGILRRRPLNGRNVAGTVERFLGIVRYDVKFGAGAVIRIGWCRSSPTRRQRQHSTRKLGGVHSAERLCLFTGQGKVLDDSNFGYLHSSSLRKLHARAFGLCHTVNPATASGV